MPTCQRSANRGYAKYALEPTVRQIVVSCFWGLIALPYLFSQASGNPPHQSFILCSALLT